MSAYALNRMMYDLRLPAARTAIQQDLERYLSGYDLTSAEQELVRRRDWQGLVEAGASVYVLTKIGAALDVSLLDMGAAMRGMTSAEFARFVARQNERVASYALAPTTGGSDG